MKHIVWNASNVFFQEITVIRFIIDTSEHSFDDPVSIKPRQADAISFLLVISVKSAATKTDPFPEAEIQLLMSLG